jgi:hypothetical protein
VERPAKVKDKITTITNTNAPSSTRNTIKGHKRAVNSDADWSSVEGATARQWKRELAIGNTRWNMQR